MKRSFCCPGHVDFLFQWSNLQVAWRINILSHYTTDIKFSHAYWLISGWSRIPCSRLPQPSEEDAKIWFNQVFWKELHEIEKMFVLVVGGGGGGGGTSILFCQIFREKSENENGGGEGAMGAPRSTTVFSTEFQPVIHLRTQYNNRSKIDVP